MKKSLFIPLTLAFFSFAFWLTLDYSEQSPLLRRVSYALDDVLFKARYASEPAPASREKLVVVAVDDESSFRLGLRWPWPRSVFAKMIEELTKKQAAVIGLNFTFTGLEDGKEDSTLALAEAFRAHGKVVVGSTLDEGRLLKPNPILLGAGARYGFLEKIVDDDFVIRRSYLVRSYRSHGQDEPAFPLAVWKLSGRDPGLLVDREDGDPINYLVKAQDLKTVPAWKLLDGSLPRDTVRGKTVLIGITSSLLSEEHRTPLGLMPGVVVHANEWVSLEEGRRLRAAPRAMPLVIAWTVGAALLLLFLNRRVWWTSAGFALTFFLMFFAAQTLFARDLALPLDTLLLGPILALGIGIGANLVWLLLENQGLARRVLHDKMTGLYTYDYLRMRLDDEWKRCVKLQLPVSIAMTDLDRFKKINDTLGHETGNQMILRASAVIRESVRGYDVVSRYGGDEFVILLWHANRAEAHAYRERLRAAFEKMATALEEPMLKAASISIGVASFDPAVKDGTQATSPQQLIELADKDLFNDKRDRRRGGEEGR